jgi:hypothetical protein
MTAQKIAARSGVAAIAGWPDFPARPLPISPMRGVPYAG